VVRSGRVGLRRREFARQCVGQHQRRERQAEQRGNRRNAGPELRNQRRERHLGSDRDGTVDDAILAAAADADEAGAGAAENAPISDIAAAKARMTDIAVAVASSL